jgi:MarR family transcriptional regulator, negative regulator of the multidrug operon emrRAB
MNCPKDNTVPSQIDRIESGLKRVAAHFPDFPVAQFLLSRLIVMLGRDLAAVHDRLLHPQGLSEPDFKVLMVLFSQENGSAYPSELCARLAQSPANITRISDALVERGLITRSLSEQDRRRMVLKITPQGERLLHEFLPSMFLMVRQCFAGLSDEDIGSITSLLRQIAATMENQSTRDGAP